MIGYAMPSRNNHSKALHVLALRASSKKYSEENYANSSNITHNNHVNDISISHPKAVATDNTKLQVVRARLMIANTSKHQLMNVSQQ